MLLTIPKNIQALTINFITVRLRIHTHGLAVDIYLSLGLSVRPSVKRVL